MKLLVTSASPYGRKVRVLAIERGIPLEIEPTAIAALSPGIPLSRHNPLQKVPTLLTDAGEALYDSRVICDYLDNLAPGPRLIPEGAARAGDLCLEALADGVIDAAVTWRTEMVARPEDLRWEAWAAGQLGKIHQALDHLETRVGAWDHRLSLGRIATVCALGYLDFRDIDLGWKERHPALAHWFAEVDERPSFVETRPF